MFSLLDLYVRCGAQIGVKMNYQKAMEWVEELKQYGMVLGLGGIKELCNRLGNPQNDLQFIHIAGTNGKGSTLAYISTILTTAEYRTGRYISPTVYDYQEKIQVSGKWITQKAVGELLERIKKVCHEMEADGYAHPTVFEIETAMAFLYFKEKECQIVVLETGLGGRIDATNVIENTLIAVLTSISMDHIGVLGNTLEEIAREKAGIIKNGCYVISAQQELEVEKVLREAADLKKVPFYMVDMEQAKNICYGLEKQRFDYQEKRKLEIGLAGTYQIDNAITALEVIKVLSSKGFHVTEEQIRKGLKNTQWEGRFNLIAKKPLFIVDGAHSEDAAIKFAESVRFYFTNKRIIYIMGVLRDKEYEKIIEQTYSYAQHIITVTPPDNSRGLGAYDLASAVKEFHPQVTVADSVEEAIEIAYLLADKEDVIIAFGSLSYLGRLTRGVQNKQIQKGKVRV